MIRMALLSALAGLMGFSAAAADTLKVGSFVVEAVDRRVGAGGFPNTTGNPFKRVTVTGFRVLHKGKPVVPPGTASDDGAPWWDARVLEGAPQPALLLMELGAVLLTEIDGEPRLQRLASRSGSSPQWQWLDESNGQPGPVRVVGVARRTGELRALSGGRRLLVYGQSVLDVKTLAVHDFRLEGTEVQGQLERFHPVDQSALAFSPLGTQFVVKASRDRPDEQDTERRFDHALIAFDFAARRATVLPISLSRWRLANPQGIDAAFAQRVVGWRTAPDGQEQAFLRNDVPAAPWLGRVSGRSMDATSYELQPVQPAMRDAFAQFLEREFAAVMTPAASGAPGGLEARIGGVTLSLAMLRPQERRLSLFYASDWQRKAEAQALIERIAERFNARLSAGAYQHLFIDDATARGGHRP